MGWRDRLQEGPDPRTAGVGLPRAHQDPHSRDQLPEGPCSAESSSGPALRPSERPHSGPAPGLHGGCRPACAEVSAGARPCSGPHPSGWAQQRGLRQGLRERLGLRVASRAQGRGRQRLRAWGCLVLPEASRGDCWGALTLKTPVRRSDPDGHQQNSRRPEGKSRAFSSKGQGSHQRRSPRPEAHRGPHCPPHAPSETPHPETAQRIPQRPLLRPPCTHLTGDP